MRFYFDTEFIETDHRWAAGSNLELLSIGMVSEDGRELYLCNRDADLDKAGDWVRRNVFPHLPLIRMGGMGRKYKWNIAESGIIFPEHMIADRIRAFVGNNNPEFWAYYCIVPETKVLTADLRWVPIGDVRVGDNLGAFDEFPDRGNGRSCRWRKWRSALVEATTTIKRPCFDLEFDDGTTVRCSSDHQWLTNTGYEAAEWKSTESLRSGRSKIVKPLSKWSIDNSRSGGYLAAAFDGEGHISQNALAKTSTFQFRLGFGQKQNAMLAEVHRLLKEGGYTPRDGGLHQGVQRLQIGIREEVFRFLGAVRPVRLLAKFNIERCGAMGLRTVRLEKKTPVGLHSVIALQTSTRTYIADGLASHNCSHDWVLLTRMFGSFDELPPGWPMYCNDLQQEVSMKKAKLPPMTGVQHHALEDARWVRTAHQHVLKHGAEEYEGCEV